MEFSPKAIIVLCTRGLSLTSNWKFNVLSQKYPKKMFWIKIGGWKVFMFWKDKFPVYNTICSNIFKIKVLIQITSCRNAKIQMDISKSNCFSAEEAINCIPRTKKRKKVPVCEMLVYSRSFSSSILPILSWEQKIVIYRGSSRFLYHLSWSCFANIKWLPNIIVSQRALS